jgi:O-6-methylguanine DNA methyltransferase
LILSSAKRDDVWYAAVIDENGRLMACGFSGSRKVAEKSTIWSLPSNLRRGLTRSSGESEVIEGLHRIYAGMGVSHPPEVAPMVASEFLRRVYETTIRIPKGKVTTYGRLAKVAGSKGAPRAVGNAMARNPLPLVIPCHRVVRSTLQVGNYGSERNGSSRTKRELLMREGVQFDGGRISRSCVWDPF